MVRVEYYNFTHNIPNLETEGRRAWIKHQLLRLKDFNHIAAIQVAAAGVLQIAPIEN